MLPNRPRKYGRRLYYPAGLISLVLLPLFSIVYIYKKKPFDKPHVLEISWWSKDWGKKNLESNFFEVCPERYYQEISINDNDAENKIKFDQAQLTIKKIVTIKDTTVGVHFHFENSAKYKSFIRALDICKIEKAKIFVPYENDLWVFHYVPRPVNTINEIKKSERNYPDCGSVQLRCCFVSITTEETAKWERKEKMEQFVKLIKQFWLVGVLFLLLSIISIRKLRSVQH
jgi:hypothetical protein